MELNELIALRNAALLNDQSLWIQGLDDDLKDRIYQTYYAVCDLDYNC